MGLTYRPEVIAKMTKWINEQTVMLEQEIIEAKGKEIADEIDREILWSMLEGIGWHRIMLPNDIAMVNATAIKEWLLANCHNAYEKHRSDFIFEDSKDANWFTLRWSTA